MEFDVYNFQCTIEFLIFKCIHYSYHSFFEIGDFLCHDFMTLTKNCLEPFSYSGPGKKMEQFVSQCLSSLCPNTSGFSLLSFLIALLQLRDNVVGVAAWESKQIVNLEMIMFGCQQKTLFLEKSSKNTKHGLCRLAQRKCKCP